MAKELTDIPVILMHTTYFDDGDPKAYLVSDGIAEVWLPAKACELEKNRDGTYTLTLPVQLATEKGLT